MAKARGSVFGESRDNFVIIPAETYFKTYGSRQGIGFNAVALEQSQLYAAQDEVRSLLRASRHLRPSQEDTFGIVGSESLQQAWERMTGAIAATALAVVSVFLVVGGVVIMNIMLAVVTERTHEIGIRKSVGARRGDILNQFLVESSTLAGVGGLIGVMMAWVVAILVRNLTPVPMAVPFTAIVVGGRAVDAGRTLLRHLSGATGGETRSDRSAEVRVMHWITWMSGIGLALDSIRESKLRAFLTVLGVIIGTGTIIGVGSIIAGLDGAITEVLRSFGPNTIIVFKFRGGPRFRT